MLKTSNIKNITQPKHNVTGTSVINFNITTKNRTY